MKFLLSMTNKGAWYCAECCHLWPKAVLQWCWTTLKWSELLPHLGFYIDCVVFNGVRCILSDIDMRSSKLSMKNHPGLLWEGILNIPLQRNFICKSVWKMFKCVHPVSIWETKLVWVNQGEDEKLKNMQRCGNRGPGLRTKWYGTSLLSIMWGWGYLSVPTWTDEVCVCNVIGSLA